MVEFGFRHKVGKIDSFREAHKLKFSIYPGAKKMYMDIKLSYRCPCVKRDIAWFVERCLTFRKVKVEHQRSHEKILLDKVSKSITISGMYLTRPDMVHLGSMASCNWID